MSEKTFACPKCYTVQRYVGQLKCTQLNCEWSNWFQARLVETFEGRRVDYDRYATVQVVKQ